VKPSLNARGLAAWCGTDRLSAVALLAQRAAERSVTPAAIPYALFVAGRSVHRSLVAELDPRLVESDGAQVRAKVAVLPLGESLIVCDRLDAPESSELVCWPDDSSYHLARSLPRLRERWLDIGCGSAFAPLYHRDAAHGLDVNPRAIAYARLGAELSRADLALTLGDVGSLKRTERWKLISCNAPIPDEDPYRPLWRSTTLGFFEQLYRHIDRTLLPGGLAVIHATEAALEPLADLPGDRCVVAYTPDRGFAVAWWDRHGKDRYVTVRRPLTPDQPHVTYADRAQALW
jgi:SAM-dependent methyltransferase